ncbi:MAG: universal stress protein [Thermoplasmata archaeon]
MVVGFDGSPAASRALGVALVLGRSLRAAVFLVHARDSNPGRAEPTTEEEASLVDDATTTAVAAWVERAAEQGVELTAVARERSAAPAILSVAEESTRGSL